MNNTTSFYANYSEVIDSANIGALTHEGNNEYSGSANSSGGLIFDAYKSFILESVDVYTNQAGNRKIILMDNENNIINEHIEYIPVSDNTPHTILLNFQIYSGQGYQLLTDDNINIENFGEPNPQLKRTSNDIELFSYIYSDVMSLNSSYWYSNSINKLLLFL